MPGRLDEISRAIGSIETGIKEIRNRVDENLVIAERRHEQNLEAMAQIRQDTTKAVAEQRKENTDALHALANDLRQHADKVAAMQAVNGATIFAAPRLVLLASIGFAVVIVAGWMLEAAIKWMVTAAFTKFGG